MLGSIKSKLKANLDNISLGARPSAVPPEASEFHPIAHVPAATDDPVKPTDAGTVSLPRAGLLGFAGTALNQAGDELASGSRRFVDGLQDGASAVASMASTSLSTASSYAGDGLSAVRDAASSALDATTSAASQVGGLAVSGTNAVIESAKEGVAATGGALSTAFGAVFVPMALEFINDDALVTEIATRVYPLLPTPMQFAVSEERFALLLLAHRHHLVALLEATTTGTVPAQIAEPAGA